MPPAASGPGWCWAATSILEAARSSQGLERIDQIKFAILEKNGSISVIPKAEG